MYDPKMRNPYSEQWNFEVQRQTSTHSSLTLAYVGSRSKRLPISGHFNTGTPGSGGRRSAFPHYEGPTEMAYGKGWSNFNAFEGHFQAQLTHSLNVLGSYTYSKSLDVGSGYFAAENNGPGPQWLYNLAGEYGPSAFDLKTIRDHRGAVQFRPFGKGQPFLREGIASKIFGDFQFNTITSAHSGLPLTVSVPGDSGADLRPSLDACSALDMSGQEPEWQSTNSGGKTPAQWFNTGRVFDSDPRNLWHFLARGDLEVLAQSFRISPSSERGSYQGKGLPFNSAPKRSTSSIHLKTLEIRTRASRTATLA